MISKLDPLVSEMRELACRQTPGRRFFTIRELMKRCGVGQQLVYKALEQLKSDALLEVRPGGELFVSDRIGELQHWRRPSLLVALPHWPSIELDVIRETIAELDGAFEGLRLETVEFDPMLAMPHELPLVREQASGAVIVASAGPLKTLDVDAVKALQTQAKMVVIGQHLEDFGIPSVGVDDAFAAGLAVDHLLKAGHRRIAVLYCEPFSRVMELRCRSAVNYAKLRGVELEVVDCGIRSGEVAVLRTRRKMEELVLRGFEYTALLGLSGEAFIGAADALAAAGYAVPGDVSLVTIAGEQAAAAHRTPIDVVGVEIARQFRTALALAASGAEGTLCELIHPTLSVHGSTAKPRRQGVALAQ